jgi:hypothetical protein
MTLTINFSILYSAYAHIGRVMPMYVSIRPPGYTAAGRLRVQYLSMYKYDLFAGIRDRWSSMVVNAYVRILVHRDTRLSAIYGLYTCWFE